MSRLSCSLCVLASRKDLVRAAQLRPELAAEYAELEAEISHRFRNDLSMADIITAAKQAGPVKPVPGPTSTVMLGEGQLWWARFERQSDRYGSVFLLAGPDDEDYVSFESAPVGRRGRLVAVVLHTRRSGHCGDLDRGLTPSTPEIGEEITLGTGTPTEASRLQPTPPASGSPPNHPQATRGDQRVDTDATDGAVVIPFPSGGRQRDAADAGSTWRYEQHVRGGRRRFTDEVTYIGGAEGERIRKELTAVITDLLQWAEQRQSRTNRTEPREDDRAA